MIEWMISHWKELSLIILGTMTVADRIADLTPTEKDDKFVAKVRKLLKLVALKNPNK